MNNCLTFFFSITFYIIDKHKFYNTLQVKIIDQARNTLVIISQEKPIYMVLRSTYLFILVSIILLCLSPPVYSQMCGGQSKTNSTQIEQSTEKTTKQVNAKPSKKINIRVPANYRPPVANQKLITFPETVATKKKQKKLLKKRRRTKKKGCIAANM